MLINIRQKQEGFIPIFIIVIIVVFLGGFAIYNLEKNNTGTTVQNQSASVVQSTGSISVVKNNSQLKQNTTTKTTASKTVVSKKIRYATDDRDDDD